VVRTGNVLLSYPEDDIFIDIIKVLVAISIILTFPTVLFPSRVSLVRIAPSLLCLLPLI
jgi:hypothetical protein